TGRWNESGSPRSRSCGPGNTNGPAAADIGAGAFVADQYATASGQRLLAAVLDADRGAGTMSKSIARVQIDVVENDFTRCGAGVQLQDRLEGDSARRTGVVVNAIPLQDQPPTTRGVLEPAHEHRTDRPG